MNISLRKFPFPYRCALAISSDIDNASSLKNFVQFMEFLNTKRQTKYGTGLDLEIGNSFWFFNGSESSQLSYFEGLTNTETKMAPIIRSYLKSGHIDSLHSWGNFDQGGFNRNYAERCMEICDKYNLKIPVWINHGIGLNHQKIGDYPDMYGDDPNHSSYHSDILIKIGCEFAWTGKTTHIIGQNANKNISVLTKEFIQWILKRTKYRNVKDPIYDNGNDLFNPLFLRDGNKIWEFTRYINAWGNAGILDLNEFADQIQPRVLKRLILNEGIMILYTHFNENLFNSISTNLYKNLKLLCDFTIQNDIFITTTARLLKFWELSNFISYDIRNVGKNTIITLNENLHTSLGIKPIENIHLQGLTFYIGLSGSYSIVFKGEVLNTIINPPDETGKKSITIPWKKLDYPNINII